MTIKRLSPAALLLALIGITVFGGLPASAASNVTNVSFAGSSQVGGATADWTVGFKVSNGTGGQLGAGSTITVTFNAAFAEPSTPAVTLGSGFTSCTASAHTAGDVVTVTLAGSACSLKNATGSLTLVGITNGPAGSYPANTFSVSTSSDTDPTSPSSAITLTAGTAAKVAFVQGPSDGFAGTPLSPAITAQLQDQNGNAVPTSGIVITLTPSAGVINAGASATTDSTGKATFSNVVINTTALGLTLTASANSLTASPPSATFNITVAVTSGSTLTDTASDGTGSGVKSVTYYYCPGYSGSCTSTNWTPIATSTSPTNYQITWTTPPAPGPYRVVATTTDNVTNLSQPTTPTPVTVS